MEESDKEDISVSKPKKVKKDVIIKKIMRRFHAWFLDAFKASYIGVNPMKISREQLLLVIN